MSANLQHGNFPVLNCYEECYIEYCQLVTDVAHTITIYVTICCYIVTLLIITSVLEWLDTA